MNLNLENIFVTEGTPDLTFVPPPNFNEIYLDIRHTSKPVILEGPSGTGKTSTVLKVLERVNRDKEYSYFTARKAKDIISIIKLTREPDNGKYIIDDFHRLGDTYQKKLADLAKIAADDGYSSEYPKLIFVGINQIGETLLQLSPDIAKRCGIHKIKPGGINEITTLINKGEKALNIKIANPSSIYKECKGDYWLAQKLCQSCCLQNGILEIQSEKKIIKANIKDLRKDIIDRLYYSYYNIVKEFCRGKRFRSTNDSYFRLLEAASKSEEMPVDLNELANISHEPVKIAVNKVKEHRLKVHLDSKKLLSENFFYDETTKSFNVEDPAMHYFFRYLDWKKLHKDCGFKKHGKNYKYDVAISFAGENRSLAKYISNQLMELDIEVFYDEYYENNYLGTAWTEQFKNIFSTDSKFVVCLLDKYHYEKLWPTFERECFVERVKENEVIPIFLDETVFLGIPKDIVGIKYQFDPSDKKWEEQASEKIVWKIFNKLDLQ